MAAINGITVKGIKDFKGHEGEPLSQGNLYLGSKKIGFWSQDSWGGPDNFTLDMEYSERLLNEKVKELNADKAKMVGPEDKKFLMEYDLEMLMYDLMNLKYEEDAFKKAIKQGYGLVLIVSDGYNQVTWGFPKDYLDISDEGIIKAHAKDIEKVKKEHMFPNQEITVRIYRSPEDFIQGEPIKLEDIKRKSIDETIGFAEEKKPIKEDKNTRKTAEKEI